MENGPLGEAPPPPPPLHKNQGRSYFRLLWLFCVYLNLLYVFFSLFDCFVLCGRSLCRSASLFVLLLLILHLCLIYLCHFLIVLHVSVCLCGSFASISGSFESPSRSFVCLYLSFSSFACIFGCFVSLWLFCMSLWVFVLVLHVFLVVICFFVGDLHVSMCLHGSFASISVILSLLFDVLCVFLYLCGSSFISFGLLCVCVVLCASLRVFL